MFRLLFLPLRFLFFLYHRARKILTGRGNTLFHRIPDRFTMMRRTGLLAGFIGKQPANYIDYLSLLRILKDSIYLKYFIYFVPDIHFSWAQTEEIGRCLKGIAAAGKQLVAYAEGGGIKTIYLMSLAQKRYTAPNANFMVAFPSAEPFFFKRILSTLGVSAEVHTAGKFKSAGEIFERTSFSKPARENLEQLLGGIRGEITEGLRNSAGMNSEKADLLTRFLTDNTLCRSDDLIRLGFINEECLESELLNRLSGNAEEVPPPHIYSRNYQQESPVRALARFRRHLKKIKKEKKAGIFKITDERRIYRHQRSSRYRLFRFRRIPSAAFVTMEGAIRMGSVEDEAAGIGISAFPMRDLFAQLEESTEEVVVLCINSPGGGSDASEMIYQSIEKLARIKPVIAVMGATAASGGYYIACAAHRIYGANTTITGSIGVVTIRPNLKNFYRKYGIDKERIAFDRTRDLLSESSSLSPHSLKLLKKSIDQSYRLFLDRVSRGRGKKHSDIIQAAEGRVWTGRDFAELGYTDGCFNPLEALVEYRKTAGYPDDQEFRLNFYPEIKTDIRALLGDRLPSLPGLSEKLSFLEEPLQTLDLALSRTGSLYYFPHSSIFRNL